MRRGFTLIELLVVVTIIVVLLAVLVPALGKAIYQAELVQCASRLKVWGSMAVQFSQDHKRALPMAFGPFSTSTQAQGYSGQTERVLDRISDVTEHEANGAWKKFGTPWETWLKYGMTSEVAVCPIWRGLGSLGAEYYSDSPTSPAPQRLADFGGLGWGPQVWIGYQWIGGTDTTQQRASNVFAWNSRRPASRLSNASSSSVMASDLLYMNSGWAGPPNNFRAIAHPSEHNLAQPRSMAITFGDVHVGIEREEFFEQPVVFGQTGSPALAQYSYLGGSSYHWWGK